MQKAKGKRQNYSSKLKIFAFLIVVFTFYFLLFTFAAYAANISSDNYQIQIDNLSITNINKTDTNYKILGTVEQAKPKIPPLATPFSFTISDLSVDFGSLIPDSPNIQTNTLTVSGGSYSVVAFENHPLKSPNNSSVIIPDTTCNGGVQTCDETIARFWDDNSTYGFGFNMSGDDVSLDFIDRVYYRPFANYEIGETAQEIMSSNNTKQNRNATVTYKVNISHQQANDQYENTVTFVAIPGY